MRIIKSLKKIPQLTLALGFFDGVHIAHKKVISSAVDFARNNHSKSAVITFSKHPFCCLKNVNANYILEREESYKIIEALGVDYLFELNFSEFAELDANQYLKDVLVKYFNPIAIFTGYNHTFGINRTGNSEFIEKNQKNYGYKYYQIPAQKINDKIISSSAIRNYIKKADFENAKLMLGHAFKVHGEVTKGNKIGSTIGYPTANIIYPENIIKIPNGVYFVKVLVRGNFYSGIANFGIKPTVSDNKIVNLEIFIFNFNKNIYGEIVEVEFIKFIRTEQKFSSLTELKTQIEKDIAQC